MKIVMAVDDQIDNLTLLEIIVKSMGYNFVGIQDPSTLYDHMASTPPHLLMIDLALPGPYDGLDIVQHVRQNGHTTLPIIAMTATARYDENIALRAGCDAFMERPTPINTIKQLVTRFLG